MIKITDKIDAATIDGILTNAKEIEYNYGINNASTSATVSTALDGIRDSLGNVVRLGHETVGTYADWEIGDVEAYINNRIAQVEALFNQKLELLKQSLSTLNGNSVVIVEETPSKGEDGVIYRIPGTNSYSDWMWDINSTPNKWVKLATYSPGT